MSGSQANGPEIENAVLKTIAAFCNTRGGELLIGVTNEKTVIGVAQDRFPDNDKFMLHLRNLLTARLKPCLVECVEYNMRNVEGKWICHVECKPSAKEVWLWTANSKSAQFFVREGPSSTVLDGPEAIEYIRGHFDQLGRSQSQIGSDDTSA